MFLPKAYDRQCVRYLLNPKTHMNDYCKKEEIFGAPNLGRWMFDSFSGGAPQDLGP